MEQVVEEPELNEEKSQEQLDYEKYSTQYNKLMKEQEEIKSVLDKNKILVERTRGILLYLKDKLGIE